MGWEKRGGCASQYYFRASRKNGKVTKQYVGRIQEQVAQIIAKADGLNQAIKTASKTEVRSEQEQFQQLCSMLSTLDRRVRQTIEIGSQSEKSPLDPRGGKPMSFTSSNQSSTPKTDNSVLPTREQVQHLNRRASKGDQDAAAELSELIHKHREIWEPIGDLSKHTEETLIRMIADNNLVLRESLRAKLADLRSSLLTEPKNATQRLVVDHVAVTWLEVQFTRMAAIQPQQHLRDEKYWEQRLERATDRHLAAIDHLGQSREVTEANNQMEASFRVAKG